MGFKRLERALTTGNRWYGQLVATRPLIFCLLPLLITILFAPGLFFMKNDDDIVTLFTPFKAPSRREQQVAKEFSYVQTLAPVREASLHDHASDPENNQSWTNINSNSRQYATRFLLQSAKNKPRINRWTFVLIAYKNESNILNVETLQFIGKFLNYLYSNFSCQLPPTSGQQQLTKIRNLRYEPDFCDPNDPAGDCPRLDKQFLILEELLNRSASESNIETSNVRMTYPVMYVWNRPVNWGHFLYGAKVNKTKGNKLESARLLTLRMPFQFDLNDENNYAARQCQKQMTDFILSLNHAPERANLEEAWSRGLRFYVCNEWFLDDEVNAARERTLPCTGVTAFLVALFTTISSYYVRSPIIGAVEALLGLFTIGLSLVTTFSLIFMAGLSSNFVVTITPLLTLCVGIDNDFLLMSAWRRPHLRDIPAKERLALAFAEAGPSVTITSINDILCFAVGCMSENPAISDFCLFTCVALTLRYLYQLTFFAGALVYINEKGSKILESFKEALVKYASVRRVSSSSCAEFSPSANSRQGSSHYWSDSTCSKEAAKSIAVSAPESATRKGIYSADDDDDHVMHRFFRNRYSQFISRPFVRLGITIMFLVYMTLSFILASKLDVNITPKKLFMDQSPLQQYYNICERYVYPTVIGNVIVTRPPDFRNKSNIRRFMNFVDALERVPKYSPDPKDTTILWLRDYLDFTSYVAEPGSDFYDYLSMFLEKDEYSKYINDLRFNYSANGKLQLESFQFSTFYQNVLTWDDSANIMLLWRRVCQNYSDFDAIVFDYFFRNGYLDQRLTLSSNTLQTMGIASLSISFVTSLLMPDAASMFFICFSSLSVDLGVIAALNTWGSDLDPTTMVCLLMTIGLSVYYTARICYCYQRADKNFSIQCKIAYTLGSVGWPILQGGMATVIGIIPLVFVPAYMVRTFLRTIVLVVFIGLMHGLVFMPVLMSLCDRHYGSVRSLNERRRARLNV